MYKTYWHTTRILKTCIFILKSYGNRLYQWWRMVIRSRWFHWHWFWNGVVFWEQTVQIHVRVLYSYMFQIVVVLPEFPWSCFNPWRPWWIWFLVFITCFDPSPIPFPSLTISTSDLRTLHKLSKLSFIFLFYWCKVACLCQFILF